MRLHDVLRHLVQESHFGSEENRAEALEAIDADDPDYREGKSGKPSQKPYKETNS